VRGSLSVLLIGILLTSSVVSQISPVFGEPKTDEQNEHGEKNGSILEFTSGVVLLASSTTTICHVPPGNQNNAHMITVGTSSLTAHINHGDSAKYCENEMVVIQEFSSENIVTGSSTTLTEAIEFMDEIVLSTTSDSKVGPAISQVAKLHQLFAHEDKETKKEFQKAFLEFIKKIKEITKNDQGVMGKKILNDLGKASIKINLEIEKDERKEDHKNKIKTAIKLGIEKEELQKIRNQISMAKINHNADTDEFEKLVETERKLLTKVLISEAKSNGEKITIEKIKEIGKKSSEIVDNNHKTNTEKGNSDNNKGTGSNDKSDKGNNKNDKKSQKSSGKGKGKNK
jgi:hypothetical protein